jgi:membrane-bound serine protease (ClpP class)
VGLKTLFGVLCFFWLALGMTAAALDTVPGPGAAKPDIFVLTIAGPITPVSAHYFRRGLQEAEDLHASAVILRLDTPGGLDSAMREMVKDLIASRIPVVVWVAPAGGRAASAGMFITIAAHVAAMAPDTAIGAAHPVSGSGEDIKGDLAEKVTNDAAAYARGLATQRGRNAEWVEQAVRKSVSITAKEALRLRVVDVLATDIPALRRGLEGRRLNVAGVPVTLHLQEASLREVPMSATEQMLFKLADPTVALILMNIGVIGILIELQSPGAILPGVVGVICLLLGLFALGTLPINGTGIALIIFGLLLFVAEALIPSFGLLTVGGILALILGGLMLFGKDAASLAPAWPFIITSAVLTGGMVAIILHFALKSQHRPPAVGVEAMEGQDVVVSEMAGTAGIVHCQGELWRAVLVDGSDSLRVGEIVTVERVEGLTLYVRRKLRENQVT